MKRLNDLLDHSVKTMAIAGHISPDGDCVGSTTALYQYILAWYPWISVSLYLEKPKDALLFLNGLSEEVFKEPLPETVDLFVSCDVSSVDRLGNGAALFGLARKTLCIDHHVSNPDFADVNIVEGDSPSCAEVLFRLFEEDKITPGIAESLAVGMIHDTGVFQYSNVRPETFQIASKLLSMGVPFSEIIDKSFNERTLIQNRILGYALMKEELLLSGRVAACTLTQEEMSRFGAVKTDLDAIIAHLRETEGCLAAVFGREKDPGVFKLSLRSNSGKLDVSKVALAFGGGGHLKAAGCTIEGTADAVLKAIVGAIGKELGE
ncbi:MAG: bifunctional oligoribonuclease/PAP phosphatase NrnA [Lachnospiraceae bacterium]|nr:bifunctional oligoribonuclease/PAP phosphatase NrnA [Lachnospiraceae bacterium]